MGMLLCEQNFRDVWSRNEIKRAEICQILLTNTHTLTHTHAAKLVVEISACLQVCPDQETIASDICCACVISTNLSWGQDMGSTYRTDI